MTSLAGLPTLNQAKVDPKLQDADEEEIEEDVSYDDDFERGDDGASSILDSRPKVANTAGASGSHQANGERPMASPALGDRPASQGGRPGAKGSGV